MVLNEIWQWVMDNYQVFIIIGLLCIFIFWKNIIGLFKKKKVIIKQKPNFTEAIFFDQNEKISSTMQRQKELLEAELNSIAEEGMRITCEEKNLFESIAAQNKYNAEQKNNIRIEKNILGARYTLVKKQIEATERMIQNQEKLEEELKVK